jgi:hypothetical protein
MTQRPTSLEPAPGRVLVTPGGCAWTIKRVHPNGKLVLSCPFGRAEPLVSARFDLAGGDWIAADLVTAQVYARLVGVKLA